MLEFIANGSHTIGIMPFRKANHDKAMKLFEETLESSKEIEEASEYFWSDYETFASKEAGWV